MKAKRKRHNPQFKARVGLEVLKGVMSECFAIEGRSVGFGGAGFKANDDAVNRIGRFQMREEAGRSAITH